MTKIERYLVVISLTVFIICCFICAEEKNLLLKRIQVVNRPYSLDFYHIRGRSTIPNGIQVRMVQPMGQVVLQHYEGFHEMSFLNLEEGVMKMALKGFLGRRDTVYLELP